jgi:hypothetical protein
MKHAPFVTDDGVDKLAVNKLRRAVALRLGRMVMEYSRLEMELGLLLHGIDGGREAAAMALELRRADFNQRLGMLRSRLRALPHAPAGYGAWVREADEARRLRNRVMHGRWGFHPDAQTFTNVRGDPFSDEQTEETLTLADLDARLEQLRSLRRRLHELRRSAPL